MLLIWRGCSTVAGPVTAKRFLCTLQAANLTACPSRNEPRCLSTQTLVTEDRQAKDKPFGSNRLAKAIYSQRCVSTQTLVTEDCKTKAKPFRSSRLAKAIYSQRCLSTQTLVTEDCETKDKPFCSSRLAKAIYSQRCLSTETREMAARLDSSSWGQRIFIAPHTAINMVRSLKLIGFGTSMMGMGVLPLLYSQLWERALEQPAVMVFLMTGMAFNSLFVLTPLLANVFTRRQALEIYFNKHTQMFTSVHYTFFMGRQTFQFLASDIRDPDDVTAPKSVFSLATIIARDRSIVFPAERRYFTDDEAYDVLTKPLQLL